MVLIFKVIYWSKFLNLLSPSIYSLSYLSQVVIKNVFVFF